MEEAYETNYLRSQRCCGPMEKDCTVYNKLTFSVENVGGPVKENGGLLNHLLSEHDALQPFLQDVLQTEEDYSQEGNKQVKRRK
jgi:hypothetical protein